MKNVVITGGSSGIGLSAVKAFAALGYRVLIIARNQAKLEYKKY
ncbi:MAG: SDR family NAD(P)-dependent oxidoreductase [Pseudomonadota bacterium]|jgi:NAD(P)-dependent dehydrogenase (short-subunit alcohol dehydrogenase family)|nr:SDR family NAD(P)-dependent oxidoreductase [Pseudomonadota bacterium]